MSKLYDIYLEKKKVEQNIIYLFKSGNFYIMLGNDALIMNKELSLKLTNFSKETSKCGFPILEYEKYIRFISLLGYEYEVVLNETDQILNDIKKININNLNGNSAINKIIFYKELLSK